MRTASRSIGGVRDQRQLAHARQRQLQRARDRRRRQRQHVHVLAQLLQALLVRDAEVLLLVDDDEAEAGELHLLAEQRMRADHDIDGAGLEARPWPRPAPWCRRAARLARSCTGRPWNRVGERLEVLAREQRRRHHDRDLQAGHRRDERRTQRHLGLAEADVAAHQPVHRLAAGEIFQHRVDAGLLVLRLLVGEARHELVPGAFRRRQHGRLLQLAHRRDLDQLGRDLAQALLEAGLARLPRRAAETVELYALAVRAVARQQLDVLDRQDRAGRRRA